MNDKLVELLEQEPLPGDVLFVFDSPVIGAEPVRYTIERIENATLYFIGGGYITFVNLITYRYVLLYGLLTRVIFSLIVNEKKVDAVGVVVDHGLVGAITKEARMKIAYHNVHVWNGQACYTPNTCWVSREDVVEAFYDERSQNV